MVYGQALYVPFPVLSADSLLHHQCKATSAVRILELPTTLSWLLSSLPGASTNLTAETNVESLPLWMLSRTGTSTLPGCSWKNTRQVPKPHLPPPGPDLELPGQAICAFTITMLQGSKFPIVKKSIVKEGKFPLKMSKVLLSKATRTQLMVKISPWGTDMSPQLVKGDGDTRQWQEGTGLAEHCRGSCVKVKTSTWECQGSAWSLSWHH